MSELLLLVVIDECHRGHRFPKLPDHPKKDGQARCPHCLAIGLDAERGRPYKVLARQAFSQDGIDRVEWVTALFRRCEDQQRELRRLNAVIAERDAAIAKRAAERAAYMGGPVYPPLVGKFFEEYCRDANRSRLNGIEVAAIQVFADWLERRSPS